MKWYGNVLRREEEYLVKSGGGTGEKTEEYRSGDLWFDNIRNRAAKLRLLNFLSLFRDLQKPTRFSGGGGSSRIFPLSARAFGVQWGGG